MYIMYWQQVTKRQFGTGNVQSRTARTDAVASALRKRLITHPTHIRRETKLVPSLMTNHQEDTGFLVQEYKCYGLVWRRRNIAWGEPLRPALLTIRRIK